MVRFLEEKTKKSVVCGFSGLLMNFCTCKRFTRCKLVTLYCREGSYNSHPVLKTHLIIITRRSQGYNYNRL